MKEEGIRVYTVGVGDDFRREILQRIARQSGGEFFDASKPEELAKIYERIDRLERSAIETVPYIETESYYRIPLGVAILLLGVLLFLKLRQGRGAFPAVLSLVLSLAAFYGPTVRGEPVGIRSGGGDLWIALDVSRSMDARDLYPDRLHFALHKAERLLEELEGIRAGILLFAERPWLVAPPSGDHEAVRRLLRRIDLKGVERERADWTALLKSVARLGDENKSRALLIFGDGEGIGDPGLLAESAREARLKVLGYATATEKGATIPEGKGLLRDSRGDVLVTRLDPRFTDFVRESGGRFFAAKNDDGDVREMAKAVKELLGEGKEKSGTVYRERNLFWIPLLLALTVFLIPWRTRGVGSA